MEAALTPGWRTHFKLYKELSKSGIVALVLISVLGGYLIGQPSETTLNLNRLLLVLFGVLFLASGSSALNQLQEWQTDALMPRTAKRPLPSGRMSQGQVTGFILVTIGLGLFLLWKLDPRIWALGILAVASYNGFYTLWWKRHWAYAAVPGAVPGALPILMGFAAAHDAVLHPAGLYLFFILFFWQMPHFWVLALKYKGDYEKGAIPTLPVSQGEGITRLQITLWCLAYLGLALMAPLFLKVGPVYLAIALSVSLKLLWELRRYLRGSGKNPWLSFFLWVNFSLIFYIGAVALDLWFYFVLTPLWIR